MTHPTTKSKINTNDENWVSANTGLLLLLLDTEGGRVGSLDGVSP
jgi:hypothetical protein